MATLVLTTVGTIVGGPIGGAIGALVGQQVDSLIFAPKGRQGPRLGDLTVQTSSYGSAIPRLFGTMRVSGTVIWATDLREDRSKSGGGKGKPSVTTYSYSASFAVALSGRPVRAVHRIWADGKLLRGAAGDWKSEVGAFRLHKGDEAQTVDPLLASVEGAGNVPAHRGIAYAVFEGLQLADFGNHIPSLTFEVEADAGPVGVGTIATVLGGGDVAGATAATLDGYAASGDSVRGAIEALSAAIPLSIVDDGTTLRLGDAPPDPVLLADGELGAGIDGKRADRRTVERVATGALPDEVSIQYYEPARDYQAGLQRARRGGPGRRVEKVELAAALTAGEAKAIVERRLADAWAARASATVMLPWRRAAMRPGDAVALEGGGTRYRISQWSLDRMVVRLKLAGTASGARTGATAEPGRGIGAPDAPHGPTVLALLDLPPLDDLAAATPRIWIAAAGPEPGWRRAALMTSIDGGASWDEPGATAAPAVIGAASGILPPGDATLIDRANAIEVELLNATMWLESRDDDALVAGANVAMLGEELIQFGDVVPLGANRFRLSRLMRGRRGTEHAMAGHVAGERFVLVEARSLLPCDLPAAALGANVRVMASGVGDSVPVEAAIVAGGRALRPPPPVHLAARRLADGTLRFAWTRRSRAGWAWLDGGDAPLGEEDERYRLTIAAAGGNARTVETGAATYDYPPAAQDADGVTGRSAFTLALYQLGSIAPSMPAATAAFTL